jgi:hypothetical protein
MSDVEQLVKRGLRKAQENGRPYVRFIHGTRLRVQGKQRLGRSVVRGEGPCLATPNGTTITITPSLTTAGVTNNPNQCRENCSTPMQTCQRNPSLQWTRQIGIGASERPVLVIESPSCLSHAGGCHALGCLPCGLHLLARRLNDWAPVHQSIAGPVIFGLRRIAGMHQLYLETS